jgi:phage terminase large subunit-like protein
MTRTVAHRLSELPADQRRAVLSGLSEADLATLEHSWEFWRLPHQVPPDPPWRVWLQMAGRGTGKNWSGVHWTRAEIESGRRRSIALVAPTHLAGRKVMIEDGFLRLCPPYAMPTYEMATGVLRWPNGGMCHLLSSETPDRARGYNFDAAWCDEVGAWENAEDTWNQLSFATRVTGPLGDSPVIVVTTTPRPTKLMRTILADPGTKVTHATMYDNPNLDPGVVAHLRSRYEGTRIGRQELLGEMLFDVPGALWTHELIDTCRIKLADQPDFQRVVVGVDPPGGAGKANAECGIVVGAKDKAGHGFVLADLSGRMTPEQWARTAVGAFHGYHADRIVAEQNFGGQMVESTIRNVDRNVSVRMVVASRGKQVRAEPVSAIYEQHKIHHVGEFPELEAQMCEWDPAASGPSPDRLDALVWCMSELVAKPADTCISMDISEYFERHNPDNRRYYR